MRGASKTKKKEIYHPLETFAPFLQGERNKKERRVGKKRGRGMVQQGKTQEGEPKKNRSTIFVFWRYGTIWIQTCLDKNHLFFGKAGLYPNYLISPNQKTWYYKWLLNIEFLDWWDSGWICGIPGIRRFRHPTAHCGITVFLFVKSIGPPVPGVYHVHTDVHTH